MTDFFHFCTKKSVCFAHFCSQKSGFWKWEACRWFCRSSTAVISKTTKHYPLGLALYRSCTCFFYYFFPDEIVERPWKSGKQTLKLIWVVAKNLKLPMPHPKTQIFKIKFSLIFPTKPVALSCQKLKTNIFWERIKKKPISGCATLEYKNLKKRFLPHFWGFFTHLKPLKHHENVESKCRTFVGGG